MSIATELENYKNYLSNAYNKCSEKGATIPSQKNLMNLTNCIDSISATSGGGSASDNYNIFVQNSKPTNKNGVWIKKDSGSNNAKFISYGTQKGNTINPSSFDYLKTASTIVGQVIVNGKLYSFGTSSSTSFVYDFKTRQKSELNVPTISVQISFGAVHHNGKIYVFYVSGNQNSYYEFDIGSNVSTTPKQLYQSRIIYSTGMRMACEPYFYDGEIYMFTGFGTTSNQYNYKYTFDIETKTMTETSIGQFIATYQYEQGFISGEGRYVYVISRSGTTACDLRRFDLITNQISVLKTFLPADFETETYVPSENCLYINNGYAYIFFSMSGASSKKYVRYNMTTKESELLEVDYSYFVNMYDNYSSQWVNTNQRLMLDETSGILYIRDKGVSIYGYQFENSPAIEILEEGTIVVIQGLDYSHATQIIDSSGLIVDVSNVYVVEDGELNGDLIVYVGDGEKWNFLKGFVRVTLDTGEEVSYISAIYEQPIAEPSIPTKDGYEFVCWTLNGSEYDFSTPVTEPITLEAKWIEANPTFIDYIESTGTQYIDTEFVPTINTQIEFENVTIFSSNTYYNGLIGSQSTDNGSDTIAVRSNNGATNVILDLATTRVSGNINGSHIIANKNGITVDGTTTSFGTIPTIATPKYPLYIFATNQAGTPFRPSSIRTGIIKIYDNGTLVRDFKPCKDTRGVYCMYDEVTKKYYYNQGTGEFKGSDWQPTYIESSGTQYIDTNFEPNQDTTAEIEFSIVKENPSTDYSKIFGSTTSNTNVFFLQTNGQTKMLGGAYHFNTAASGCQLTDNQTYNYGTVYNIKLKKNELYVNGVLKDSCDYSEFSTGYNMYIFANNKEGVAAQPSYIKLYKFKIYDGDTLVRDYIPALDDSGVACLYDKVSETYFYNAGTGTFTVG